MHAAYVRVWRYDATRDAAPKVAGPADLETRRAVLVAAPDENSSPVAWMAIDDYDANEGTLLFGVPPGDDFREYVRALLSVAVVEAPTLGFASLLAHWRAGWASAESVLEELGFERAAPGIWRRRLSA